MRGTGWWKETWEEKVIKSALKVSLMHRRRMHVHGDAAGAGRYTRARTRRKGIRMRVHALAELSSVRTASHSCIRPFIRLSGSPWTLFIVVRCGRGCDAASPLKPRIFLYIPFFPDLAFSSSTLFPGFYPTDSASTENVHRLNRDTRRTKCQGEDEQMRMRLLNGNFV